MREAHLSGPSCTVSSTPRRGFTPLHLRQGSFGFSVAAFPIGPFPRRPICNQRDWVEQGITALSARRSRTSPITGIRLQRMLSQS